MPVCCEHSWDLVMSDFLTFLRGTDAVHLMAGYSPMPLPMALGAVVAASAAVLKAKCTFLVGTTECGPACLTKRERRDPFVPKYDLRDEGGKRREAQRKLEEAEASRSPCAGEQVQQERAMMREQQQAMAHHREESAAFQSVITTQAPPTQRHLVDDPSAIPRAHTGLHSTGSVFVSSIDSSNASIFFLGGNTPFKAVLITETSSTPQWFKALA